MHKNHCQYYFSILSLLSLLIITSLCNLSFLPISFVDAATPPLTPTNFDLLLALTSSASYSTTWTPSVAVPSNIVFRTDSKSAPDFTSQGANFIPTRKIDPKMTAATSVSESTGVAAASFANPSTTFSFHSFVSFSVDNLPVTNQGLSPIIGKSCYNSKRKTLTSQYLFGLQKIARKTYRVCIDMYSTSISSANEAADAFICTPTITAPDDSITTYTAISIGYNSSLVVFYVNGVRYTVTPAPSATVTTTIVWPLMLGAIPTCDSGPTSTKDRSDCVNGNSLSDCSVENSRPNIYTASHTLRELYFVNGVFTENSLKYMQCYFSRTSNSQQSWCPPGCGNGVLETDEQCEGTENCLSTCICKEGYYNSDGDCLPCQAGYYCTDGVSALCTGNTYSESGASLCSKCPVNSTVSTTPATSFSMCTCLAGYFLNTKASECSICPVGSYCVGNTRTICDDGKYSPTTGRASCLTCPTGSVSTDDRASCVCTVGVFSASLCVVPQTSSAVVSTSSLSSSSSSSSLVLPSTTTLSSSASSASSQLYSSPSPSLLSTAAVIASSSSSIDSSSSVNTIASSTIDSPSSSSLTSPSSSSLPSSPSSSFLLVQTSPLSLPSSSLLSSSLSARATSTSSLVISTTKATSSSVKPSSTQVLSATPLAPSSSSSPSSSSLLISPSSSVAASSPIGAGGNPKNKVESDGGGGGGSGLGLAAGAAGGGIVVLLLLVLLIVVLRRRKNRKANQRKDHSAIEMTSNELHYVDAVYESPSRRASSNDLYEITPGSRVPSTSELLYDVTQDNQAPITRKSSAALASAASSKRSTAVDMNLYAPTQDSVAVENIYSGVGYESSSANIYSSTNTAYSSPNATYSAPNAAYSNPHDSVSTSVTSASRSSVTSPVYASVNKPKTGGDLYSTPANTTDSQYYSVQSTSNTSKPPVTSKPNDIYAVAIKPSQRASTSANKPNKPNKPSKTNNNNDNNDSQSNNDNFETTKDERHRSFVIYDKLPNDLSDI